jgi:RNA polymerase sigma factor (sigma-70 family)
MQTETEGQVGTVDRSARPADGAADQRLITRVIQGEQQAQQEFVSRYQRLIYAVLSRYDLTADEREDLYQQVFVHLWERDCSRISQWKPDGAGRFSAFLCVIVSRLAVDHFRSRRGRGVETPVEISIEADGCRELSALDPDPYQQACRSEQGRILLHAMEKLSPRDRDLLLRRYYRQQTYAEIATALNITVNYVGVALLNAHRRLRKELCLTHPDLFAVQQ